MANEPSSRSDAQQAERRHPMQRDGETYQQFLARCPEAAGAGTPTPGWLAGGEPMPQP